MSAKASSPCITEEGTGFSRLDHDEPAFDDARLSTGTVLDDKYRITGHLGVGGMGSVYSATHLQLGKQVAIKVLHPHFAADHEAVVRFQREARIISGLQHKHILAVYAFSSWRGIVYMAMELVEGHSLGQQIASSGPLKAEQAVPLLLQICDAMTFAHKNDVLHRDLKPDNVIVVQSEEKLSTATVKVVDFGLAKLQGDNDMQRLTRTGEVFGDPSYMSPEQCQGKQLDARSDIYSFGCLMYEVFSGQKPFPADNPVAILMKQVSQEPPPLPQQLAVPPAIEAIIWRAMQKDPAERYDSFDAIAAELRNYADNPEAGSRARLPARSIASQAGKKGKQRLLVTGTIAVGVFIAAAGMYLASTNTHNTATTASEPYEHLSPNELRQRAYALMTSASDAAKLGQYEDANKTLAELQRLRRYLVTDEDTQGHIDYNIAFVAMAEGDNNSKALQRKALDYYCSSAEHLKKARTAILSSSQPLSSLQLLKIEEGLILSLDGERRVAGYLQDKTAADRACRETLDFCEGKSAPIDKGRSHSAQASFDWLFSRAIQTKRLKRAYRLMKRKIAFLEMQKVDPGFLQEARASMEHQLVEAAANQQGKRFTKFEDAEDATDADAD